jgi:hypothetical protein
VNLRPDIVELLRAGCSDREVARRLHADTRIIAATRTTLGLPRHKPGRYPASSPQDFFRKNTRHLADGHMEWTGHRNNCGTPVFFWNDDRYTAGRVAFVMRHGRAPVGMVLPGCGRHRCVAPDHLMDQPMRQRLNSLAAAIFGGAA